jgi:hypothetical protein
VRPSRVLPLPLALLLVATALVFCYMIRLSSSVIEGFRYYALPDDGMISMRYAYNLVHGQGLVWNIGDPVEGITNLGWTLVMALVHLLNLPLRYNSLAIQVINLVLHLCLIAYVYKRLQPHVHRASAFLAALLVGFNLPLFAWAASGFETSLQTLLITMAFLDIWPASDHDETLSPRVLRIPILCGLAYLVRPDAIVFFAAGTLIVLNRIVRAGGSGSERYSVRALLSICAGAALIAMILLWQKSYYGSYLPNTFYLKVTDGARSIWRAIYYWKAFAFRDGQFVYILGAAVYLLRRAIDASTRRRALEAALVIVAWSAYIFGSGGDVFILSRFFTPILPLLIVSTVMLVDEIIASWHTAEEQETGRRRISLSLPKRRWELGLVALTLLLLAWQPLLCFYVTRAKVESTRRRERPLVAMAIGLHRLYPASVGTIGIFWAGTTPYFLPSYRFHDCLGKSDAYIAHLPAKRGMAGHNKWDYAYSLGKVRPALILTSEPVRSEAEARKYLATETGLVYSPTLMLDPLFLRYYKPNRIPIRLADGTIPNQWLFARSLTGSTRSVTAE